MNDECTCLARENNSNERLCAQGALRKHKHLETHTHTYICIYIYGTVPEAMVNKILVESTQETLLPINIEKATRTL